MHNDQLLLEIDNPILANFSFRVIEEFLLVVALKILWIVANHFHYEVSAVPNSIVARVKMIHEKQNDFRLCGGGPKFSVSFFPTAFSYNTTP
jgi:hypothetical protein